MADENNTLPDDPGAGGESPAPAETSLHDDIARAFEEVETRDAPPDKPGALVGDSSLGQPPGPAGERARDPATGRFLPGGPEAPAAGAEKPPAKPSAAPKGNGAQPPAGAPVEPKAPPKPPLDPGAAAAPPPQQHRAPTSWKPGAREHWAKLPAEVQAEVVRRETEVAKAL